MMRGGSSPRARRTDPRAENRTTLRMCARCRSVHLRARGEQLDEYLTIVAAFAPPTVHLRARGEQSSPPPSHGSPAGSSPRARRTARHCVVSRRSIRFISARAENSPRSTPGQTAHPVHLRARGEQSGPLSNPDHEHGSSPRARRTDRPRRCACSLKRFISARAENSGRCRCSRSSWSVHLRARGEQKDRSARSRPRGGSSPRARRTD